MVWVMLGAPRKLWIYVTDWALGVIPHPSIAAPEGWPKQETDPLRRVFRVCCHHQNLSYALYRYPTPKLCNRYGAWVSY